MTRLIFTSIRRGLAALAILPAVVAVASCTSLLGDFNSATTESTPDATSPDGAGGDGATVNPGGKMNGAACAANGECALGFCTDGVCCESACDGVCEKCNLPGSPGKCMPVPMNTDPDMECVAVPIVAQADAGTDAAPPMEAGAIMDAAIDATPDGASGPADGGIDGGATDGGAIDAAVVVADGGQAGLGYNPPDGGIVQMSAACAGTCNGQRACSYPDQTKTCGTQFCNTAAPAGRSRVRRRGALRARFQRLQELRVRERRVRLVVCGPGGLPGDELLQRIRRLPAEEGRLRHLRRGQ